MVLLNVPSKDSQTYSEEAGRNKNVEEYNATADKYDAWCKTNSLMQNYSYFSTFAEIDKVKFNIPLCDFKMFWLFMVAEESVCKDRRELKGRHFLRLVVDPAPLDNALQKR